jgi:hypothetical protein
MLRKIYKQIKKNLLFNAHNKPRNNMCRVFPKIKPILIVFIEWTTRQTSLCMKLLITHHEEFVYQYSKLEYTFPLSVYILKVNFIKKKSVSLLYVKSNSFFCF